MMLKRDEKFEKNYFVVSKMKRIWWILAQALKNHKNLHFDWFLLCKVFNVWPKKVSLMELKSDANLKKNWLVVWKMTWGKFDKFWPEHLKVSKLWLWWGPFVQSRKSMRLKFTEELCVITMKNDANLKRNWLVISKLTSGIWRILTRALENLKNLLFSCWLLWPKYVMFELKKHRGVTFDGTVDWCRTWRKTDLCFQKWHEEFGKFA